MKRLTMVVPCFNESSRLPVSCFVGFANEHPDVCFVMVNDGSNDSTQQMLDDLHTLKPNQFIAIHLPHNQGKAEAVRQGMLVAFASSSVYVGFMDADLATPLDELPRMVRVLDEQAQCNIVLGTRLSLLGHDIDRNVIRYWLGRIFATVASGLLGIRFRDTQCGMKLFRSGPSTRRIFERRFMSRWIFDVEFLARYLAIRGRASAKQELFEWPLVQWTEVPGSKVRSGDFLKAFRELLAIYWHEVVHRPNENDEPEEPVLIPLIPSTNEQMKPQRDAA